MHVTFILWAIAGMLLFQHWIIILLGVPIIPLTYIDLIRADKDSIDKFGDDYKTHMKMVQGQTFCSVSYSGYSGERENEKLMNRSLFYKS